MNAQRLKKLLVHAKKFVVIRTDRIGELLLASPIMRNIKTYFPGARCDIVVSPSSREIVEGNPSVDEILEFDTAKKKSAAELFDFSRRLAHYDVAIVVNPSKVFHGMVFLAGIPVRVGYARKWGFLLNHALVDDRHRAVKHEVEYNLDLVRSLGIQDPDTALEFLVGDPARQTLKAYTAARGMASAFDVLIHPFASNPAKCWPYERCAALAERCAHNALRVAYVGGGEHIAALPLLYQGIDEKTVPHFIGKLSVKELGALLENAKVLVSADSGPVHIASACGCASVVLFSGASSPVRWGPRAPLSTVLMKDRIDDITVDGVFFAMKKILLEKTHDTKYARL